MKDDYQKLRELAEIFSLYQKINNYRYDRKKLLKWWNTSNMNFGGSSPRKLWENNRSHKVVQFLNAALNGY